MILATICLATIGVLVKSIGEVVPIMSLSFLRMFIAFLFLLLITPITNKDFLKIKKEKLPKFLGIGIIYAIAITSYNAANFFTTIHNAVILHYMYPFFVLFFAYFLLKEKITKTKAITLAIALFGILVVNPLNINSNVFGNLLALFGAIFYGILITEMRAVDKEHCPGNLIWFIFFASLILLPFAIIYGFGNFVVVIPELIFLGVVSTALAYMLYNIALEKMEAETASVTAMIFTPLISIILAIFLIGETLNLQTILGGLILVIAGVYLETHSKKIKKEENEELEVKAILHDVKNKNPKKLG
jgi:drug/metabolite transporter (DMT)-like permease